MDNRGNFFEIIDTRRTVRKFSDDKLTKDEIERIIESARLAPSAVNAQNWKFYAIVNQEVKEQMASAVSEKYDEIIEHLSDENVKSQIERFREHSTFFKSAPLIVVAVETQHPAFLDGILEKAEYKSEEIALMRPDSQLLSMGGAIENMILTAHAMNYASCWMVAPVIAYKKFSEILKLDNTDKIVTLLAIGKPKDDNHAHAFKKELKDIMKIIE